MLERRKNVSVCWHFDQSCGIMNASSACSSCLHSVTLTARLFLVFIGIEWTNVVTSWGSEELKLEVKTKDFFCINIARTVTHSLQMVMFAHFPRFYASLHLFLPAPLKLWFSVPQGSERYTYEWERCLASSCRHISNANNLFNTISSSSVCNEVLKSPQGYDYVFGERTSCVLVLSTHNAKVPWNVCVCECVCVYMCVCVSVCVNVCACTCVCVCVCACVCACVLVLMYVAMADFTFTEIWALHCASVIPTMPSSCYCQCLCVCLCLCWCFSLLVSSFQCQCKQQSLTQPAVVSFGWWLTVTDGCSFVHFLFSWSAQVSLKSTVWSAASWQLSLLQVSLDLTDLVTDLLAD